MNSSYKITLLVTIVLCGLIIGYYFTQDEQNRPPKVDDATANVAINNGQTQQDTPRPTLRGSDPVTPPPAARTDSSSTTSGSLLDRVNAQAQNPVAPPTNTRVDPIAPPPANTIPDAASNRVTQNPSANRASTTPVVEPRAAVTPRPPDTGRAALRTPTPATGRTYTVKSGDTLSSIAKKTLGSESQWTAIGEANPFLDPRKLKVGQVIRLPDPTQANDNSTSAASSASTPSGPLEYVVRSGDTLSSIAKVHYADPNLWDVIYRANKKAIGSDPAGIRPGMKLFIPPEPRTAH